MIAQNKGDLHENIIDRKQLDDPDLHGCERGRGTESISGARAESRHYIEPQSGKAASTSGKNGHRETVAGN